MENRGLYIIPFKGLSLGSHSFDWTIDRRFFAAYEKSEIDDAFINVHVTLMKHTRFLELDFLLEGWAETECDRCLDLLKLDIASENKMYVKFGDDASEDDADDSDVLILPLDEDHVDVAQYIYEYAHLSLPLRRVHPDDANGRSTCNQAMLDKLKQYLVEEDSENDVADPYQEE